MFSIYIAIIFMTLSLIAVSSILVSFNPIFMISIIIAGFLIYSVLQYIRLPDKKDIKIAQQARRNMKINLTLVFLFCLSPIVICHIMNGDEDITSLSSDPVEKVIEAVGNDIKDQNKEEYTLYYTICPENTENYSKFELPSDIQLTQGPAIFKPVGILPSRGALNHISNWVTNKRKIALEITQNKRTYKAITGVKTWQNFKDSACGPQDIRKILHKENTQNELSDKDLDKKFSEAQPF